MLYEITDVLSSVMLRATPSRVRWMSASPFLQLGESAEARRGEEKIWTELQPLSSFSAAPASFFFCRVLQVIRDRWTPRFAIVRKPSVACRGTQDKKYSAKSGQSGRWPRHLKPQGPELMHTARRHDEPWSQAFAAALRDRDTPQSQALDNYVSRPGPPGSPSRKLPNQPAPRPKANPLSKRHLNSQIRPREMRP